jgi:WD40 repeat protein
MSTELASGVAPLANGENGGRRGTILASFLINHLKTTGFTCQFFFFRFGDQTKRSVNFFLRSIAFQIAQDIPTFRRRLNDLSKDGMRFEKTEAWTLWQKLFVSILFKIKLNKPLYWVIDALDESDSPEILFNILSSISSHNIPICVLVLSRKTPALSHGFEKLAFDQPVNMISAEKNISDMRFYVEEAMKLKHWTPSFKQEVASKIIAAADRNFLWVSLALKEILLCHTSTAINQALEDIPTGMESLYKRMETTLANTLRPGDRELAKRLLVWASCSRRALNLKELTAALEPEFPIMDLKDTILDVCGQFVIVDDKSQVAMVHRTARDYLMKTPNLPFSITLEDAHQDLFERSIIYLMDPTLPSKLRPGTNQQTPALLSYAATSWTYHLSLCSVKSESAITLLAKFLRGSSVLTWIQALATLQQLKVLINASKTLMAIAEKVRKKGNKMNTLHNLEDLEILDLWAVDYVKILGKFGGNLLNDPQSIHNFIPQFCPHNSITYRQFGGESSSSKVTVAGLSNHDWDDCLAKFSMGRGCQALMISCAGRHFAILASNRKALGTITLWDSMNFEEVATFLHAENVSAMCFSDDGQRFVSYGFRTMKVRAIPSGRMLVSIPNPLGSRALAITFAENDTSILTGSDDKVIRKISLGSVSGGWQILVSLGEEATAIDGAFTSAPCFMAFNPDATQIAVAHRGFPLSVWGVDDPRLIGMCKRVVERRRGSNNVFTGVKRVSWNPRTGGLLGIYNDGCVFKWYPTLQKSLELRTPASDVQCSPDGATFATCDNDGTIRLWDYQSFALLLQLSGDEPVTDFVFSPECRRFYDLRGAFCNVWEPNVLARISETDERDSNFSSDGGSGTFESLKLEEWVVVLDLITAISGAPDSSFYCTGNDEGVVELFDSSKGKVKQLWRSSDFMMVDHIVWSDDCRCIAAAELGGHVTVKSITSTPPSAVTSHLPIASIYQ